MIKSNKIYLNDSNLKIFDQPGANIYGLSLNQVIPSNTPAIIKFNTTVYEDNPGMVQFDNDGQIRIQNDGMYSINCVLYFESATPNSIGMEFTAEIILQRENPPDVDQYILFSEGSRIEAQGGIENLPYRKKTLSTVSYITKNDYFYIAVANDVPSVFDLNVMALSTKLFINRIY